MTLADRTYSCLGAKEMPPEPLAANVHAAFSAILREELIVATGCTEPIAVAYASALAARVLGREVQECLLSVSGNIVKNVNSVTVPNTGGLFGLPAACAAGITVGDATRRLEVLADATPGARSLILAFLERCPVNVSIAEVDEPFYIDAVLRADGHEARVAMSHSHTHVERVERDGEVVYDADSAQGAGVPSDEAASAEDALRVSAPAPAPADRSLLNVVDIVRYADQADLDEVRDVLERQASCNYAIAQEGLTNNWGARVGKLYRDCYDQGDILNRAKAAAAAASDARMSGCPMPVVILSGSGNQGITASVPVVVYAKELGISEEKMLRALIVSNLVSIYQKTGIGCLSAFCGAVSAGCGAAAGIAYLLDKGLPTIEHTIVNALGVVSGMVCDGAKPSCAAKIAAALDAGMFGLRLYENGNQFFAGDGIVTRGVDSTIGNVSRMAREGMRATDREILNIMIGK